jgi:hypothetical protein
MSQNTAHAMFFAGLFTFILGFGTELSTAHSFAEVWTPSFVGRSLVQLGGVGTALFGALKMRP